MGGIEAGKLGLKVIITVFAKALGHTDDIHREIVALDLQSYR
jgi:hypothetical protein